MPLPGLPATVQSITVAGRVFTDVKNLKILKTYLGGTGSNSGTFRELNGTAGYQVPASKSFRVLAVQIDTLTAAASGYVYFQYTDNDQGLGTATAAVSSVIAGGSALVGQCLPGTAYGASFERPYNFLVPTGKYIGADGQASAAVHFVTIYGYEE